MAPATIKDLATAASEAAAAMANAPSSVVAAAAVVESSSSDSPMATTSLPAEQQQEERRGVARGALIVLEGLDRSGKTTQVKLLEQRFVELGRKVKVVRFPGTSTLLL